MGYPDQDLVETVEKRTNTPVTLADFDVKTAEDVAALRARWSRMESNPKILASREGSDDVSFAGLDIKTLLRGEESSGRNSVHSIVMAPGTRIPAHGNDAGEAFWVVVHGEVDLTIGSETMTVPSAGFGFAPARTTQAVANRSAELAEVFVIHLPAGIERGFAAAHRAFGDAGAAAVEQAWALLQPFGITLTGGEALANDSRVNEPAPRIDKPIGKLDDLLALRCEWNKLPGTPKLVKDPCDCYNVTALDQEARVLLSPEESRGAASAFCNIIHGGIDVPPHHQPTEEETFIVLRGEVRLRIGNQTAERVGPGAFGFAPRYGTHAFKQLSEGKTFLFSVNTPGGHDRGFEISITDSDKPNFPEIITAHGFTFHGPPD
ncbi:cupin domain-containing protein [Croceicoccus bisphenolivorans]|uniref:cupin domain-containing protein n=1 Tax=Croceicoccus bisphenolivorans TaxID=1783232 RepID=UPI00082C5CF1|nr:cupin domain-containing protein [Croceicoccus bisphenolivorans]